MTLAEIAALLGLNLALILAAMGALWALSLRSGRIGFLDGVWPLLIAGLAATSFIAAQGDPVRKGLLLWLVAIWAAPQAWRRLSPRAGAEADARYAAVSEDRIVRTGWSRGRVRLITFFLPQGALAWVASLPVQLGQVEFLPPVGWVGWTGAVLAVAGIGLEGVGSLRRHPTEMSMPAVSGWRRWLRRPDYLGDLAVWWGLFLIAAETTPGQASVIGPIFLTFALAHWAKTENPRRVSDGG
ncbi:DUF1295 domain-containing protein [Roseibacterium beibuensis]|uniref:DUF1295 domain-containing protein n=1 Tax=[Roseibacterium] beibuensis TaxID=1193142 RepID=UPI00217DC3FE|nr:DUF1295 domain-containing protein [Roseibacterium beibuensis]MCS6624477.1 DUF1295 domain-containing protein [Roseibacterium beibuensis]